MCVYIYIYIYMCVFVYIYICIYIYVYIYMCVFVYICVCVCVLGVNPCQVHPRVNLTESAGLTRGLSARVYARVLVGGGGVAGRR